MLGSPFQKDGKKVFCKWAVDGDKVDFKYTFPEDPANSVDTYMFLNNDGVATWMKRSGEFHEWRSKEGHEKLPYAAFEEAASWNDPRQTEAYKKQKEG